MEQGKNGMYQARQRHVYSFYRAIFWIGYRLREPEMGCLLMLGFLESRAQVLSSLCPSLELQSLLLQSNPCSFVSPFLSLLSGHPLIGPLANITFPLEPRQLRTSITSLPPLPVLCHHEF